MKNGKGSTRRASQISEAELEANWLLAFGHTEPKKKTVATKKPKAKKRGKTENSGEGR